MKNISLSAFTGIFTILIPLILIQLVVADDSIPRPNKKGDYYLESSWKQWLVVTKDTSGLKCRRGSGQNYPIFKIFNNNEVIFQSTQTDPSGTINDKYGKPWLVSLPGTYQYNSPCYVRANSKFIRPIPK